MKSIGQTMCGLAIVGVLSGICSTSYAHMAFKKQLQKKYVGMKVSCNACHVKGKPKTDRTEFGKLFEKQLKVSNPTLTADWKPKKGADKKQYVTATMVPAFDKALAKVKTSKNKQGQLYDDLIKNGQIAEIKKDPKYKPESTAPTKSNSETSKESQAKSKKESATSENGG